MSELLTRLNAKVQNITDAAGGYGGLTPQDISHALAGKVDGKKLPRGAIALGEVLHNDAMPKSLFYELYTEVVDRIDRPKEAKGKPYIKVLAEMAVVDVLPGQNCPKCEGRGVLYKPIERIEDAKLLNSDGLLPIDCDCIDGKIRMADKERADIIAETLDIKVTSRDWLHKYSWDYAEVLSVAVEWAGMVDRHLYARLEDS